MNRNRNSDLTPNARSLRKNMTGEERRLWYEFLKELPVTVNRQKVIGNYILDFYCASAKLVIELDGSQHYEDEGREADRVRDAFLESLGLKVLRYSNRDIRENFPGACEDILAHLSTSSTPSVVHLIRPRFARPPSPRGEGESWLPPGGKLSAELTDEG